MYQVIDSNNGEVIAKNLSKFDAQMKASSLNNSSNGYKYAVEMS
jgi:hypothetical protein